ncbi:MAG: CHRD domain-containing protein [Candidatus Nitrosopolaris sp.]
MLKTKFNILAFGTVGLATALLIFGAAVNGFINYASAQQQQQQFTAKLSGKNEVPPVTTPATGIATFTVSPDGSSLNYVLSVSDITGVMGAHLHAGPSTQNGPTIAGLFNPSMTGHPTGKVHGSLSKGIIRASNLTGPLAGKELSDLILLIKTGNTYVNVHTTQNRGGEIRGQLS